MDYWRLLSACLSVRVELVQLPQVSEGLGLGYYSASWFDENVIDWVQRRCWRSVCLAALFATDAAKELVSMSTETYSQNALSSILIRCGR